MCGIVGYLGKNNALPVLVEGLKRLEYRGYDSSGVSLFDNGSLQTVRAAGRITALEDALKEHDVTGKLGIAHTRWATHGKPTVENAHPHMDYKNRISLVHNGIIENYTTLKKWLLNHDIPFRSETDSEVMVNLISYFYHDESYWSKKGDISNKDKLEKAIRLTLMKVEGTYGICVIAEDVPDTIIIARLGSPMVMGVGDGEYIISSDAAAIVSHTTQAIYLNDHEIAVITSDGYRTSKIDDTEVDAHIEDIEFSLEEIELAGHTHYMSKEIFEQPETLAACLKGRLDLHSESIHLGGIANHSRDIVRSKRLIMCACGTAWHAALLAEYIFEELCQLPTEVDYASEFRYRNPIIEDGTTQIILSQSGETLDTLAALREAKSRGAYTLGIVNAVGSTIARETDSGIYLHVGPEIGVASTKAFTGLLATVTMLALYIARRRHMSPQVYSEYITALEKIPKQIGEILKLNDQIKAAAEQYCDKENWLFLGRGYQFPIALEGALKLKEISYIHAEGLPAAEMKHGPIALITEEMPVVFLAPQDAQYNKVMGNVEEVKARGGQIIGVVTEGDTRMADYADHVFTVPKTLDALQGLLTVIPLQLLAYHAAVLRGHDVDKPRNLAKSVTVE